ncbi:MAG: inosine-5-monophosphate dehydrogenase [Hyphococcus sp.]|nr:MAG: inosine-5-monophosphate dehydrogenase [Marinicaulis sp.]
MKVEQILQSKGADVFAVKTGDTIASAVSMLNEKNIGAVVVENDQGSIAGILSERDVVRKLGEHGVEAMAMRVSECMTPDPITCSPEATLEDLMGKMTQKRIRHLPVTNEGRLVGVVSIGDVVKRKIEIAEQEAQALKDYIAT